MILKKSNVYNFCILLFVSTAVASQQTNSQISQIYLDVLPANTSSFLTSIRSLPLSTYTLSYERGGLGRTRVGPIGPEISALIPEAVEIVKKRTLPPGKKGDKPIVLENVPVVHDQTLFMYGLGATKELAVLLEKLENTLDLHVGRSSVIEGTIVDLERLTGESGDDGEADLRIRDSKAQARRIKSEVDLDLKRAQDEIAYIDAMKEAEVRQLIKSEEITVNRINKEDVSSRLRASENMLKKLDLARQLEIARADAAEVQSNHEHLRQLEIQRAMEKLKSETVRIEAIAKAEAERANEDVKLRLLKAEGEQRRIRNVAAVKEAFVWLGEGIKSILSSPRDCFIIVGYFALAALSVYVSRETASLVRNVIESLIGKPKLIRETSKKTVVFELISVVRELFTRKQTPAQQHASTVANFSSVILPSVLKARVTSLAISASRARLHSAPHRHVLLYGPPGTGKTMVAKLLAHSCNMDYAMMSGGDVGPLGADGVTQIHQLFRWAKVSRRGVLLFVDEAEAFLGSRSKKGMSENAHNALNALLFNTGGERKDFMLVLATNRAEDLDAAVLDRCDESLLFPLPDGECREMLLKQYFNMFCVNAAEECNVKENVFWRRWLRKLPKYLGGGMIRKDLIVEEDALNQSWLTTGLKLSSGFSGREIGKSMIAVQGAMFGSEEGLVSRKIVEGVLGIKAEEHKRKGEMNAGTRGKIFEIDVVGGE